MSRSLQFTLFEKFELAVSVLCIHHRRLGIPAEINSPLDEANGNFRPSLQIAADLVDDIQRLVRPLAQEELVELARLDELLENDGSRPAVTRLMRGNLHRLRRFDENLQRAQVLGRTLLRLTALRSEEYDSFAYWVNSAATSFRRDRCWTRLRSQWLPRQRLEAARRTAEAAIQDPMIQHRVNSILARLLYILALLRHVDAGLGSGYDSRQILRMVHCYYRCRAMFVDIDDLSRSLLKDDPLREMLDFCNTALKLEASQALKKELRFIDADENARNFDDRMGRAVSIMQNALEQTLRNIFQKYDPEYDSGELGQKPDEHYDETVELLEQIKHLSRSAEKLQDGDSGAEGREAFFGALDTFREQWLPGLFRRDRKPFEALMDEVASSDESALPFALHRFQVFVTTLLSQVRNRGILDRYAAKRTG